MAVAADASARIKKRLANADQFDQPTVDADEIFSKLLVAKATRIKKNNKIHCYVP
jgi:hypothetical protein